MQYRCLFVCMVLVSVLVACGMTTSSEEELSTSATPLSEVIDDVVQGITIDGYHFLGEEDAPVVIQFYSDFF